MKAIKEFLEKCMKPAESHPGTSSLRLKTVFCTVPQLGHQLNALNGNESRKIFWRNLIEKSKDWSEINLKVGIKKGAVPPGEGRWNDCRNW
jgi:hypothetical protein